MSGGPVAVGAELLARYLRQRRELGETELVLDPAMVELLRSHDLDADPVVTGATVALPSSGSRADPEVAPVAAGVPPGFATPASDAGRGPQKGPEPNGLKGTDAGSGNPVDVTHIRTLQELEKVASTCPACRLCETRTQVVFADGDPNAKLVVVGEAPGADEDRIGRPFVGRAGKLLDQLLLSVGFPRETVYICNVIKCRPPGNRNPHPDEVRTCSPYLRRQLEFVGPKAILAVGTFAAQTLLETTDSIGRLRGSVHEYQGIPLVPTYHPAALLRNSGWIRPAWEDLQRLREILDR